MTKEEFSEWFKKTSHHKKELNSSEFVACYYCFNVYSPKTITEWCDRGETAICPKCGIDAVVPYNISNHEEELKVLKEAHKIGFGI